MDSFALILIGLLGLTRASCPPAGQCYHGGMKQHPEADSNKFPQCWTKEAEGHWGCYKPLNGSCQNIDKRSFLDIFSCQGQPQTQASAPASSQQSACSATKCFHGGQPRYPETNPANFPSCFWKEGDGTWGCYNPIEGSCNRIKGVDMFDIRSCQGQAPAPGPTPVQKRTPRCPDLASDTCHVNFDPAQPRRSDQPQFWVYSNNMWGCSDNPQQIASRGQVINLMDPPAECRRNNQSPYICE